MIIEPNRHKQVWGNVVYNRDVSEVMPLERRCSHVIRPRQFRKLYDEWESGVQNLSRPVQRYLPILLAKWRMLCLLHKNNLVEVDERWSVAEDILSIPVDTPYQLEWGVVYPILL